MKVRFLRSAIVDLRRITGYIALGNPAAAERFVRRIDAHLELITATGFAAMARVGRRRGTRELVEGNYIITYRYDEQAHEVVVLSVVHGARRR